MARILVLNPNSSLACGAAIDAAVARFRTPGGPAMYRTGCLGRLSSFSETDDGRYLVTLTGICRFFVQVELEMQQGYRRVRADLKRFQADLAEPSADGIDRAALLAALRAYFKAQGFDANWDAIYEMPDGSLVSTLAMVCPFEPSEKQALLEAPDEVERARALVTLLQMGAHAADTGLAGRRVT